MKRLGRVLGNLLAVVLTVFSLQAMAETPAAGRSFDHTSTGFPLLGGHATAACETCHVGGVFKGTPRNCDGCHALGKRVVATPKSTSHIVTDAPCESCHFNTFTFLGARYNHGTAVPGQCLTCHNGRIATGRPATHNSGFMLTDSCDHCHRSYAFVPASWNHVGVLPGSCENAGCHLPNTGNRYYRSAATLPRGKTHMSFSLTLTQPCDTCHNFVRWTPPMHMPVTGTCISCHNDNNAQGSASVSGHPAIGTEDCSGCHFTVQGSWLPALNGLPNNHIPYNAGTGCRNCHTSPGGSPVTGPALHTNVSSMPCTTCHLSGTNFLGNMEKKSVGHEGMKSGDDCSKSGCHRPLGSRGTAYVRF